MYHCSNCQSERFDTEKVKAGDVEHLRINYECGSYVELLKDGHNWKRVASVVKCGLWIPGEKAS